MDIFVTRLRQAMFLKGVNQADLARRTGFTDGKVSSWCTGKYRPNAQAITKIANVLGVSTSYLLGEGDDLDAAVRVYEQIPTLSDEEKKLLEAFRNADETKKQIVKLTLGLGG